MTEQPKQADGGAQGDEQRDNSQGNGKSFLRENPTFFLTLMYVELTAIGIFYAFIFYRQFGINIFDFADIGDFLLAAVKVPLITFSVAIGQVMFVVLATVFVPLQERLGSWVPLLTIVALTIMLLLGLPLAFASSRADAVKQGEPPQVTVQYRAFSGSAGQVTKPGLVLIGTTQRAVFFYDVDAKRTLVIPQAQVVSIEVPE